MRRKMKWVRVDAKTLIQVPRAKPDQKAVDDWLDKRAMSKPSWMGGYKSKKL